MSNPSTMVNTTIINPIYSIICYIGIDLLVTAVCSFTLTPYLLSIGLSTFSVVLIITFASFVTFGIGYYLYKQILGYMNKPIDVNVNMGNTIPA